MKRNAIFLILITLFLVQDVSSQGRDTRQRQRGYASPGEVVTFDSTMAFNLAISALNELSRQYAGKSIVVASKEEITSPIGIPIIAMHWRDALEHIANLKGFAINEKSDMLLLLADISVGSQAVQTDGKKMKPLPGIDNRQVMITTIVVGLNVGKLQEYGIDWSFSFLNPSPARPVGTKDTLNIEGALSQFGGFDINVSRPFKSGSISALLNFISSNNIGDVINTVKMVIPEGDSGSINIGQQISIPTRSIGPSGEVAISSQLIPTGTQLKVKPLILKKEEIEYVYADFTFTQSSLVSGGELPILNDNTAKQTILALSGEEIAMSGYTSYNETNERVGIPFLKDLPPWFLGLRYIFGSERTVISKTQIVYMFKIEILPSIRERAGMMKQESDLDMMRNRMDSEIEKMRSKKDNE